MERIIGALRAARRSRGLTQHDLATALGTTQSAIARFESGRIDPHLSTLVAYADATDHCVHVSRPDPVSATAATVADRLAAADADGALRALVQLADDLDAPSTSAHQLRQEPDSTGARRWDAALAAVVERAARRRGEPAPGWTAAPSRFLDGPWFPIEEVLGRPAPGLACLALASAPPEFAARGIHLDPTTFESV